MTLVSHPIDDGLDAWVETGNIAPAGEDSYSQNCLLTGRLTVSMIDSHRTSMSGAMSSDDSGGTGKPTAAGLRQRVRQSATLGPMVTDSGYPGSISALVTREVRWFREGPLPSDVLEWFIESATYRTERRVDLYDVRAAEDGIGRKQRETSTIDSKVRVSTVRNVSLAPGLTGHVEDWLKISRPIESVAKGISNPIEVEKHLHTRRFSLDGHDDTGCEVELAEIRTGSVQAWSLCFETFGPPDRREDALRAGVEQFLMSTSCPDGLEFTQESCLAYPDWITRLALETSPALS
jgi:hypothetical protein